jgi:hypothetical protein
MIGVLARSVRGTLRLSEPGPRKPKRGEDTEFRLSEESKGASTGEAEPSWLTESRKLIPGEALAGYLSLQPLAAIAKEPENLKIVLAMAFCAVTALLRWFGSQDPGAADPKRTTQAGVVVISTACFICLVYATGGQVFWHEKWPDQSLYGQIGAAALGILGPAIYRRFFARL